ncbi:MAG: type II secretion system F family protein, partial [Planctomycetota bacterium]
LVDGLRAIADQETKGPLQSLYADITSRISAGHSVADSLEPHRKAFGGVYVDTIRAAEVSGSLSTVLDSLADMLEREDELRKSVRAALMYPMCVMGVLVLAMVFLLGFVLPKFGNMFRARGLELPAVSEFMLTLSSIVSERWGLLIVVLIAGGFIVRHAMRQERVMRRVDEVLGRAPVVGQILRGLAVARFSQVLGIGLRSGVSLITALESAGRASARPALQRDVARVNEVIQSGGRVADGLRTCRYIPSFARRLASIGEEAGELPRMLDIIATQYEREVRRRTKALSAMLEPLLILFVTGLVLLVALSIFLPMWSMAELLGG